MNHDERIGQPAGTPIEDPGLCGVCVHARRISSNRAATFYLCELSFSDERFAKYPTLPMLRCEGWVAVTKHG